LNRYDIVSFLGHAVVSESDCEASPTCEAWGLQFSDRSLVKAPYCDPRDVDPATGRCRPGPWIFTHTIPEGSTVSTRAKVIFIGACALGDVFRSLWSINDTTSSQVLIVPTVKGTHLYWAALAWIEILMRLTDKRHMSVYDAVKDVNDTYLNRPDVTLRFQAIGANGGRNVKFH
jgi:hypothetical protein